MDVSALDGDRTLGRNAVMGWATVVNAEFLLVASYLLLAPVTPTDVWIYVYPFVWINVAIWATRRVDVPAASRRRRYVGGMVALGYLFVLGYLGGL